MNKLRLTLLPLLLLVGFLSAFGQGIPQAHCPLSKVLDSNTTSGATQLIAIPTIPTPPPIYINGVATANPLKPSIHVCSIAIRVVQPGSSPANFGLVTGTGTNCGTGQANLTPQWVGTISVTDKYEFYFGEQAAPITPPGTAVCAKLSAAPTGSQWFITYGIY